MAVRRRSIMKSGDAAGRRNLRRRPGSRDARGFRSAFLGLRKTFVQQCDKLPVARMISQPVQIRVVLDPVFPELSAAAAKDSIQQVKSRVEFSQATVNARDVVYADRVFLLDGLTSRCPLFRPVLFS